MVHASITDLVAMRGHLVPILFGIFGDRWVPLESSRDSVKRNWDIVLLEAAHDPPYSCS
jgi:hypothetical protein